LFSGNIISVPKSFLISSGKIAYISEGYTMRHTAKTPIRDKSPGCANSAPAEKGTDELTIFFTNSTNALLDSCNCPKSPYGGTRKKGNLPETTTGSAYKNNFLLDSGDIFSPYVNRYRLPVRCFENI
jgi:hypothetical protein